MQMRFCHSKPHFFFFPHCWLTCTRRERRHERETHDEMQKEKLKSPEIMSKKCNFNWIVKTKRESFQKEKTPVTHVPQFWQDFVFAAPFSWFIHVRQWRRPARPARLQNEYAVKTERTCPEHMTRMRRTWSHDSVDQSGSLKTCWRGRLHF